MSNIVSLPPPEWTTRLLRFETGAIKPVLANAIVALRESPTWMTVLAHDEFTGTTKAVSAPPWTYNLNGWQPRAWTQHDDILTTEWLQNEGIIVGSSTASQAVEVVARERTYHPVLDYLDSLEWDGKVRLDAWVTKFLGALDTPYNAEIGRRALIAAVARVRSPGCKVDTVPIIEGGQGVGKSSAARVMFDPWFSDDLADLGSKDAAMQTQGSWLIEISELDAMSRAEVSRTKAFITRTTDRFRPPYGSRIIESQRSCVFWGTTNSDRYLKDETGGRRFWPIAAGKIDLTGLRQERDLLWAEANQLFERGVGWWIVNPEVQSDAVGEQTARYVGDPWDDIIGPYLAAVYDVTIVDILRDVVRLEPGRWSQADSNRVARCLVSRGFQRVQVRTGDKRSWRYKRPVTSVTS
jgi:predicted P-loop ATPase